MNKLETYNARLKAAKLGTRIEERGNRLYIVATLPPKPKSDRTDHHQQRIALHCLANGEGLAYAYKQAQLIGGQIATNNFNWDDWLNVRKMDIKTIEEWIEEAKRKYLENGGSLATWNSDYYTIYKKLPETSSLCHSLLNNCLYSTLPNSRTRRRAALALAYLADIIGIEHDFRQKTGDYSPKRVSPRNIPSDNEIQAYFYKLADHPA